MPIFRRFVEDLLPLVPTVFRRKATNLINRRGGGPVGPLLRQAARVHHVARLIMPTARDSLPGLVARRSPWCTWHALVGLVR